MSKNNISESLMMERRITLRLLGYWEKLRGERMMPTEQDIDPDDLDDLWDNCMLVHTSDIEKSDYNYTYMGEALKDIYKEGVSDTEQGALSALNAGALKSGCQKVIDTKKPLIDEGEFANLHNEIVKYRLCLLPLGEADDVQAVFGGMRFKVYKS